MARQKTGSKKPGTKKPEKAAAAAEPTLLMPSTATVRDCAVEQRAAKRKTGSISLALSGVISAAVSKKHLDKKAFNIAASLAAIEDDKDLHRTYYHLLRYLDDLNVVERATAQGRLFEDNPAGAKANDGEETGEGEGEAGESNVRPIGGTVREVAEKAGAKLQ